MYAYEIGEISVCHYTYDNMNPYVVYELSIAWRPH